MLPRKGGIEPTQGDAMARFARASLGGHRVILIDDEPEFGAHGRYVRA
jgi:hypothetical protein